jgi:phosphoglycolate phosphatase
MIARVQLVLFDLDGTLVDTAPDLAAAANRQRAECGLEPLPLSELRPVASHGARGLIGRALGRVPGDDDYEELRVQFLEYYEQALCVHSRLFGGMEGTLAALEGAGIRWGIVTNKIARFTEPLIRQLGLSERAACVVSGDTTLFTKPHPEPLLHAIKRASATAAASVFVGDDLRDVQSGRAAGTTTIIAAYGYLGDNADVASWGGDHIIEQPADLLVLMEVG